MKIALIGYGKMGKEIEQIALQRNHTFPLIIDIHNQHDLTIENLYGVDVAIEFTNPDTAVNNIKKCFAAGVPVVCGTTGWHDKFEEIKAQCIKENKTLFYTTNYSLGVNIFFKLNEYLAKMMNNFSQYEVEMEEIHHTQKLDAPSGTAITLAEGIIKNIDRKTKWELDCQSENEAIKITAVRRDTVPGTHMILYDSNIDFIEIIHSAKNRKGLAVGAVLAAEFVIGKKGVLSMDDLLKL